MFKKALFLGIIGFFLSLITIYVTMPEQEFTSQRFDSLSYEDGIDGWISFGNILAQNINEAFAMKDDLFISMLIRKTMEEINLSNKPEIIITEGNRTIFWTNGIRGVGTKYTGLQQRTNNKKYLIRDSFSIVETEIISNNKEVIGYLYLEIQNKPDVKEFAEQGWQFYGHVLATSNDIRGYVADRNSSEIRNYIDKATKKENIINLTILGENKTIVWNINNSDVGWIEQEKGKESEDKFYFSQPVNYQGRELASIHFLIKLPEKKEAGSNLITKIKGLFESKYLMLSFVSFVVFSLVGSILSKPISAGKIDKKASGKSSPELQNKIQLLKEEIEKLKETKEGVIEDIAKKQKVQKDLEEEIKNLTEKKESISAEAETVMATMPAETEKKSEEDILFDKLLGENSKSDVQKKEELELTQRIVAKRREEIALSGKIEAKRKELLKLEQDIEKFKNNQ